MHYHRQQRSAQERSKDGAHNVARLQLNLSMERNSRG